MPKQTRNTAQADWDQKPGFVLDLKSFKMREVAMIKG